MHLDAISGLKAFIVSGIRGTSNGRRPGDDFTAGTREFNWQSDCGDYGRAMWVDAVRLPINFPAPTWQQVKNKAICPPGNVFILLGFYRLPGILSRPVTKHQETQPDTTTQPARKIDMAIEYYLFPPGTRTPSRT